jgi:DNA primase large subunit
MAQIDRVKDHRTEAHGDGRSENLRDSAMMAHLMDALQEGTDVGHYGRLTFVMVSQYFLDEDDLVRLLSKQPGGEEDARRMVAEVKGHGYNPPKRDRILSWQQEQDFKICPTPDDPGACNVYADLSFPEQVYASIGDFWEEKAEAQ